MKVIDIIPKFPQWEAIPYAENFACQECGKSAIQGKDEYHRITLEKPNLVGWCETNNGYMAVFECPCCHSKFRFHPQMKHFDLDQFDFYLGAYYIGDGDSIWIGNAKELSDQLDEASMKNEEKANEAPKKIYLQKYDTDTLPCLNRYNIHEEWTEMPVCANSATGNDIEYTRTDVFVEKVCSWLENNLQGIAGGSIYIEDFRKYMGGE